jgi:hypothetical protein
MTALLFDRENVHEVDDRPALVSGLSGNSILWIDLDYSEPARMAELVDGLGLEERSARRLTSDEQDEPSLADLDSYLHVRAFAPAG